MEEDNAQENDDGILEPDFIEVKDHEQTPAQDNIATDSTGKRRAATDIFVEFVEVAIHQILYVRKVYPEEIFRTRKKYNVPVHISSHPGLNEYIVNALSSLKPLLIENRICHIAILITDDAVPIENFVFEVNILQQNISKDQHYVELEQSLRSFLFKVISCTAVLEKISDNCSFEIVIGCSTDCEVDLNICENETDVRWTKVDHADFAQPLQPKTLVPIKAVTDSPLLNMQLVVEQMQYN